MMKRCPLKLAPVPREVIWGGTKLKEKYGKKAPFDRIAESWELTVRPDATASISGGAYDGMRLSDYLSAAGNDAVSPAWDGKHFPLLIKWIDAGDDLSVQVHPDDAYAHLHENSSGKTEMWYVAEAEPGARIVYGLADGVSKDDFCRQLRTDPAGIVRMLRTAPVHAGETYFLPAGQVHALGRGIVVAEIQQTSDITYRVYDFGRKDAHGNPRELHTELAKDAIDYQVWPEYRTSYDSTQPTSQLINCPYFVVHRVVVQVAQQIDFNCDSFVIVVCLWGEANINGVKVRQGETLLVPASENVLYIFGNATFLTAHIK